MREAIASVISIGARGDFYEKQPSTYSTQHPPKSIQIESVFRTKITSTHNTTQPQSPGCGGNMSGRNTMVLVFNRGGPGSYRSRERREVISQNETQFYSKAHTADSQELESAFSEQRSSLEHHTRDKTSPTRLLQRRSMMSSRRNTLLSFI